MRNRDILGRNTKFGAAPSRKAQAALALAVSLWIATGGVASATTPTQIYLDRNGQVAWYSYDHDGNDDDKHGTATASDGGKTLNIGGTWSQPTYNNNNGYSIFANQFQRSGYTLNVNGATFNAINILRLYGAYDLSPVSDHAVVITNSKFLGEVRIYGAGALNNDSINASDNTVTVAGKLGDDGKPLTSFSGNAYIYAANSGTRDNTFTNNAINLYGAAAMENATLAGYGYGGTPGTHSGNELHLGGTKSGAAVNGIALSPWQGYALNSTTVNNTVKKVQNFDKIVLHQVKWDTTTPALKATSGITFNNSTPALDISGMTFANDTAAGTMALLEGAGGNFSTLNLTYSGSTAALNNENQSQLVKTETGQTSTENGVTLGYDATHTVSIADTSKVTYTIGNAVNKISFGAMAWNTARDGSDAAYSYANVTNANIDVGGLTFTNPEAISTGTATLLQANSTLTAALADVAKDVSYSYAPVAGVTVSGTVNGTLATSGNNIQYTATANKASKLTFGSVAWTGGDETTPGTPLMTRPANISFAGANVDTSNINFTNISELEANKEMTLVSNFGDTVGTITGSKYKVGSTLQGEGKASLEGSNLIFRTDTTAEKMEVQEQTHNTVMGAEVGMATLSAGNDFIASASEGLGLAANVGADGISSFATMGGGSMRQETGSHIDTRTWNAIIALGHKNEKEKSSFEYGAFFEYGRGNYTTYNGAERGDGSMHYTGGGLLAKWQKKDGLYVEGSLRAGSVHDDAHDVLRDVNGTPYSYETNAPYWGAHIGVGKIIDLGSDHELDVYGKFYHNHRKGVSFNAGGHYDLDALTSHVVRIGARYTVKRDRWNYYGGLAYEHELDGKARGTADGFAIRGTDTSGGSLRAEIGATIEPDVKSPWKLDLNLAGFAGKKRGLTGGVSVAWMF